MMIDFAIERRRVGLSRGGGDPRGVPAALPPDHDDDVRGDLRHAADRARHRRGRRTAPAARRRGGRRPAACRSCSRSTSRRSSTSISTASTACSSAGSSRSWKRCRSTRIGRPRWRRSSARFVADRHGSCFVSFVDSHGGIAACGGACLATLIALVGLCSAAAAENWPTRPIRAIIPFGPGSAVDVVPRIVFEQLSTQLGQSIVVENRGGAGGTIGTCRGREGRARRLHDPGALLRAHHHAVDLSQLSYDVARDFVTVGAIGSVPNVLIIAPSKGIKTRAGFRRPGRRPSRARSTSHRVGVGSAVHLQRRALPPERRLRRRAHSVQGRRRSADRDHRRPRRLLFLSDRDGAAAHPRRQAAGARGQQPDSARRRCRTSRPRSNPAIRIPTTRSGWACSCRRGRRRRSSPSFTRELQKALEAPAVKQKLATLGVEAMPLTAAEFDAQVKKEIVRLRDLRQGGRTEAELTIRSLTASWPGLSRPSTPRFV